ncbi:hypothetical protein PMAYCL1PPCAC_04991, partial [Pristionchus mayeri]
DAVPFFEFNILTMEIAPLFELGIPNEDVQAKIKEEPSDNFAVLKQQKKSNMQVRRALISKSKESYTCSECDKKLITKNGFNLHMRIHIGEKHFKCSNCDAYFRTSTDRNVHFIHAHNSKNSEFSVIGVKYMHLSNRPNEIKQEPAEIKDEFNGEFTDIKKEEPIADVFCPSTGVSHPSHTIESASKPGPNSAEMFFPCSTCPKKFVSQDYLNKQMRSHYGRKLLKCSYCNKLFCSFGDRYNHIQFAHLMQFYACFTCGQEFAGDIDLWLHLHNNKGHRRLEEHDQVPEQKPTPDVEDAVKEEEMGDEEPGPSSAFY